MSDISEPTLVPLAKIQPNPWQPRTADDPETVKEIAISIFRNGMMQTPSARQVNGHYELVFGHTRKAAYELLASAGVPEAGIEPSPKKFGRMPLFVREVEDRQMFEMAVSENVKRRDLNPIEQARAMQRYMDDFHATSAEAGELFNVSAETVRGKVRLLELPEAAQSGLAAGEINESSARMLLSMKRVASEKSVLAAVEQIKKGEDMWGRKDAPDNIIDDFLRESDAKVLFHSHEGKTPRSGNDGWKLDMKNFPVRDLPALTAEAAALALNPEVQDDPKLETMLNEICEYVAADPFRAGQMKPGLMEKYPAEMAVIAHLANPPACTACPRYAVLDGTHYCGLKVCYERKAEAWAKNKAREAQRQTGIPFYSESDGAYRVLNRWTLGHTALFESRNPDLRLIPRDKVNYHYGYEFPGIPEALAVVVTGKTLKEIKQKEKEERKRGRQLKEDPDLLGMRWLIYEAAERVKSLFDGLPLKALECMEQWGTNFVLWLPKRMPVANNLEEADDHRMLFAYHLLDRLTDETGFSDVDTMKEKAEILLEVVGTLGVEVPAQALYDIAAEWQAVIDDAETEGDDEKE